MTPADGCEDAGNPDTILTPSASLKRGQSAVSGGEEGWRPPELLWLHGNRAEGWGSQPRPASNVPGAGNRFLAPERGRVPSLRWGESQCPWASTLPL